ncbi:inositol monophosphatase [Nocardioides sp. 616]|uniref:inositol monophosphatase family protein n=1 Tax=Nocardioides sp. 616 TaxID=2268090 RepID=UPI000CE57425|nr:inositol monophosphatase [Nocardioides sp. 616]
MTDAALASDLVREAGALALGMRVAGLSVERKTSVSDVVTAADRAAERLVLERLRAERPDDSIVGEEGAAHTGSSGRTWVIDPVDGTYNFHRGLEWWCSALALSDGDELVLGAVHHPHEDATYVGGPGLGSTRNGVALAPLVDVPLARACVTTYLHPPFYGGPVGEAFGRAVRGAATLRMMGSGSMDAMALAQGRVDVLVQHSVPVWDELPGAAVIRGVGGTTSRVSAGGVEWYVAGAPTAVAEVCQALTGQGR